LSLFCGMMPLSVLDGGGALAWYLPFDYAPRRPFTRW
jgi:hypothetical protein